MKRFVLATFLCALLFAPAAGAGDIDLHLHFGDPVPVPVRIIEPPLFLHPTALGFYVAVGVPYGHFYIDGRYYLHTDGRWYIGAHWGGPWHRVEHRHLPPGLAKRSYKTILEHRDAEHRAYRRGGDRYGGEIFRPGPPGHDGKPGKPGKGKGRWK